MRKRQQKATIIHLIAQSNSYERAMPATREGENREMILNMQEELMQATQLINDLFIGRFGRSLRLQIGGGSTLDSCSEISII